MEEALSLHNWLGIPGPQKEPETVIRNIAKPNAKVNTGASADHTLKLLSSSATGLPAGPPLNADLRLVLMSAGAAAAGIDLSPFSICFQ
ncbi:MAG: hypothetical protein AAB359_00770, partial [Elusimicrobiota bacterium]